MTAHCSKQVPATRSAGLSTPPPPHLAVPPALGRRRPTRCRPCVMLPCCCPAAASVCSLAGRQSSAQSAAGATRGHSPAAERPAASRAAGAPALRRRCGRG